MCWKRLARHTECHLIAYLLYLNRMILTYLCSPNTEASQIRESAWEGLSQCWGGTNYTYIVTLLLTYMHFSLEILVQISSNKLQGSATELNHYFWLPCITGPPRTYSEQDSKKGTGGGRTNKDVKVASAPLEATRKVRFTCTQLFTSWSQLYLHCVPLHAKVRFTLWWFGIWWSADIL